MAANVGQCGGYPGEGMSCQEHPPLTAHINQLTARVVKGVWRQDQGGVQASIFRLCHRYAGSLQTGVQMAGLLIKFSDEGCYKV